MGAKGEREALEEIAERLCAELAPLDDQEPLMDVHRDRLRGATLRFQGSLSPDDEALLAALKGSLSRIAAAVDSESTSGDLNKAVCSALDGTELVMRGEMMTGNRDQLQTLLPGFVFLVTLPIVHHDQALDLSHRAARIIEEVEG